MIVSSLRLDRGSLARAWATVRGWSARQWAWAGVSGALVAVAVALPTAVIPNPVFGRAVAVTWWSYPTLLLTGLLGGLLFASYLGPRGDEVGDRSDAPSPSGGRDRSVTLGSIGAAASFFAVGCPVCNKIVLIALGASGALTWFAPWQPVLAAVSIVLLAWALVARLAVLQACALPIRVNG